MGVVLFLPSIALNVVTGLDIFLCIGIMGVCSILYTMIGGNRGGCMDRCHSSNYTVGRSDICSDIHLVFSSRRIG